MSPLKLEIKTISGEPVPTIIAECIHCGDPISVIERDFLYSRPLHCSNCNHDHTMSYREYVTTFSSLGPELLAFSRTRLTKTIPFRHH
jgi:hypothetical protein